MLEDLRNCNLKPTLVRSRHQLHSAQGVATEPKKAIVQSNAVNIEVEDFCPESLQGLLNIRRRRSLRSVCQRVEREFRGRQSKDDLPQFVAVEFLGCIGWHAPQ